jgi:NAD(P)-dependent dehydrogenase (short-subunit alcohol dehydrogenase family)
MQENIIKPVKDYIMRVEFPKCEPVTGQVFKNKVFLVTGASSGIGREIALQAAKHGATLILIGRSPKKLEAVYDAIEAQGGSQPAIHPINLLQLTPELAQEIKKNIQDLFGKLDAIVHCAAHLGQLTPIEHYPPHLWQQIMQLNLNVPFLLSQTLLPLLKFSEYPKIIFSSADEGQLGKAFWGAYTCSKFAIEALKQSLAAELSSNSKFGIYAVNPRKVATPLRLKTFPAEDPKNLFTPNQAASYYLQLLQQTDPSFNGLTLNLPEPSIEPELC